MSEQKIILCINAALFHDFVNEKDFAELESTMKEVKSLPVPVIRHITGNMGCLDPATPQKLLNLLDFLSSRCPEKLQPLLQENDFYTKLRGLLWDNMQFKILSLLKFWLVRYEELQLSCLNLKTFVKEVEDAGLKLPGDPSLVYCGNKSASIEVSTGDHARNKKRVDYEDEVIMIEENSDNDRRNSKKNKNQNKKSDGAPNNSGDENGDENPSKKMKKTDQNSNHSPSFGMDPETELMMEKSVMSLMDLIGYKTDRCMKGENCPNKPVLNEKKQYRNESLLCTLYHGDSDRRRSSYIFESTSKACKTPSCKKENCSYCHGFFELMFHPLNYKKDRCDKTETPACIGGKYCPYNHGPVEKLYWDNITKENGISEKMDSDLQEVPEEIEMNDVSANEYRHKDAYLEPEQPRAQNKSSQGVQPELQTSSNISNDETKTYLKVNRGYIQPAATKSHPLNKLIYSLVPDTTHENELIKTLNFGAIENYSELYDTSKRFLGSKNTQSK